MIYNLLDGLHWGSPLDLPGYEEPSSLNRSAFLAWQFLHGGLKIRSMNGISREATFRAAFAPVMPHADDARQMPHVAD